MSYFSTFRFICIGFMSQLSRSSPHAPFHAFDTIMIKLIWISPSPNTFIPSHFIPLLKRIPVLFPRHISVHHGRHGIDLLILPLFVELPVAVGVRQRNAVAHRQIASAARQTAVSAVRSVFSAHPAARFRSFAPWITFTTPKVLFSSPQRFTNSCAL